MKKLNFILLFLLTLGAGFLLNNQKSLAVSAADWKPGRIIDDVVFQNKQAMTVQQIQQFLDSKVPVCDRWGSQPMSGTGMTRAQWSAANGRDLAPYTCLKEYIENPTTKANNGADPTIAVPGGLSAAQLIYNASQAQNINPQVYLVLLQKEQSLVTDDWPYAKQFERATGNNCPDTAPCNPAYAWLSTQVNNAGAQFNYYVTHFDQYNYAPGWNNILYNPNAACGRQSVFIENAFTAALYIYTPYVPNQAALDNMYGTGDGCSAYGNRNFWRLFNDWFGPSSSLENIFAVNITAQPQSVVARGQEMVYTVSLTNKLSYPVTIGAIGVVGRGGSINGGSNKDMGWQGPYTLNPGTPQQFTFTATATDLGSLYLWPAILYGNRYIHYDTQRSQITVRQANLSVVSPLTLSSAEPVSGELVTFSATIKNNETVPIRVDALGIPVRYYGVYNYDATWATIPGGLLPGASQIISGVVNIDKPGPYTAWISWNIAGTYTTLGNIITKNVTTPTPNFSLSYIEYPNLTPALGEDISIKFKIRNNLNVPMRLDAVGIVGRYGNPYTGANRDFGWVGPEQFAAGEEKSYTTFTSNVKELSTFYTWVALRYGEKYIHYNNWGFALNPRTPNLSISSPLLLTPESGLSAGQVVNYTFTIKNNEPKPIRIDSLGVSVRYFGVYIYDPQPLVNATLSASGASGDSLSYTGTTTLDKSGPYDTQTQFKIGTIVVKLNQPVNYIVAQ